MVLCGHMDPTFDIEDPMNTRGTKSNVVVISIIGVAVGMLIGAGIMMYISRDAVFFTAPSTENVGVLSYPDQKAPDVIQKTNILLPKKLVSKDYHLLINKILNELNQVETNNNATLLPLMNSIKQKSAAGDFNGFFDIVIKAKSEIKKNNDLLATASADIAALRKVNGESIKDQDIYAQTASFLTSGDALVQTFTDYFSILNETLSGSIPTQSLLDKLNEKITSLRDAGASFQSEFDALLALMQQKMNAGTP